MNHESRRMGFETCKCREKWSRELNDVFNFKGSQRLQHGRDRPGSFQGMKSSQQKQNSRIVGFSYFFQCPHKSSKKLENPSNGPPVNKQHLVFEQSEMKGFATSSTLELYFVY